MQNNSFLQSILHFGKKPMAVHGLRKYSVFLCCGIGRGFSRRRFYG